MNITVIHGDNSLASYEQLQKLIESAKNKGFFITKITEKDEKIAEILSKQDLFNEKRLIVVNDWDNLKLTDIKWINDHKKNYDIALIIYKNKTISKTFLNKIEKIDKVELFDVPKIIWSFMESFYPKNTTNCLKFLNEIIKKNAVEFVFAMLARHLRDVYWATLPGSEKEFQSWRFSKLKFQAKKMGNEKVKEILRIMGEIDIKVKTTNSNLKDELDLLIITQLK